MGFRMFPEFPNACFSLKHLKISEDNAMGNLSVCISARPFKVRKDEENYPYNGFPCVLETLKHIKQIQTISKTDCQKS